MKKMKKLVSLIIAAGMLMASAVNVSAYVYQSPVLKDNGNLTGVTQDYEAWGLSRVISGAHKMETRKDAVYGNYLSVGNAGQYYYNFEETVSSGKYILSFDAKFPWDTDGVKMYLTNTTLMDGTTANFNEFIWLRSDAAYLPFLRNDVETGVSGNNFVWQENNTNLLYKNGEWVHYDLVFCMDPENGNRFVHVYTNLGLEKTIFLSNDTANKGIKSFSGFMWLTQSSTPLSLDNVTLSKVESNFILGDVTRDGQNLVVNAVASFKTGFEANNATTITRVPVSEPEATPEEVSYEVVSINGGVMTLKPQADMFKPGYSYNVSVKRLNGENTIDSVTRTGRGVKLFPYVYKEAPETKILQTFDGELDKVSTRVTIAEGDSTSDGTYASIANGGVYRFDMHSGTIKAESGTWRLSFDYKVPNENGQFSTYVHTASAADPATFKQAKPLTIHAGGVMNRMDSVKKDKDAWMFGNDVINYTDWHHIDYIFNLDTSNVGTKTVQVYVDGVHAVNEIIYRAGKEGLNNAGQQDYIYSIDNIYFEYANDSSGATASLDNVYFGYINTEEKVMVGTSVLSDDKIEINAGVNLASTVSVSDFTVTRTSLDEQKITTQVTDFTFTKTGHTKGVIEIADFASGYEYDVIAKTSATQCGMTVDFPNYKLEKTIDWAMYDLDGRVQSDVDNVSPVTNKIVFTIAKGLKDNQVNGNITLTKYDETEIEYIPVYSGNTITLYLKSVLDENDYYTLSASGMLDAEGNEYQAIEQEFVTGEYAENVNKLVKPVVAKDEGGATVLLQYANIGESSEAVEGYVIYCGYQGNKLEKVDFKPLNITENDSRALAEFRFDDTGIADYSHVEIFVWDGFETMEPLTEAAN